MIPLSKLSSSINFHDKMACAGPAPPASHQRGRVRRRCPMCPVLVPPLRHGRPTQRATAPRACRRGRYAAALAPPTPISRDSRYPSRKGPPLGPAEGRLWAALQQHLAAAPSIRATARPPARAFCRRLLSRSPDRLLPAAIVKPMRRAGLANRCEP